ncbi:5-oxoprolinase subunit C family protein [Agromyces aerolatus]|uniref:5-oxoprolinase subunit C family protein n=1 Tax=Agromyces sp. LY-1074 TaxID=3074080 RepID=UPI00285A9D67|nr:MULTISPECIES: biotin-dependent carboxyltransferase family protein [unclassified Agromyces]MDR5698436.1 biotin-dependent carboxyltransferase family protein [Agromyces sp. LY-1074]MDR5704730.1 biotin-dependent carboxyltransferase family protein [Agromyces sp. LY-1358]
MSALQVERPGALALVEDLGRPGLAHLGVAESGALDRGALQLGNRLVGNPDGAAGLELVGGGFRAVFRGEHWFAVTGAWGPVHLDGRRIAPYTAARARDGAVLELGAPERGIRYLLAVRGGLDVPAVLGSRSRDTLAGLGPEPVAAGADLTIGPEPEASVPALDQDAAYPPPAGAVTVELRAGPRADWVTDASLAALFEREWRLSPNSDRIGARLDGTPLERRHSRELVSEPTVPGSMQLPPSGLPTLLLADRPVTGGYPVIAIATRASLDRIAQLRPGQAVRFRHA